MYSILFYFPNNIQAPAVEEDAFESDFASTDEEAEQAAAGEGEASVAQEEKKARKVCSIHKLFDMPFSSRLGCEKSG